jgi:hypothetical protein
MIGINRILLMEANGQVIKRLIHGRITKLLPLSIPY